MATSAVYGEKFPSKVAAAFATAEEARNAAEQVARTGGISDRQVQVVAPGDPDIDRKLEPETRGVRRTLVRAHVTMGLVGLAVGLLVGVVLMMSGYEAFTSSPYYTFGLLAGFGIIGGLLLGGLISLRPDHDPLLVWVKDAARSGRWFVLVHTRDHDEEQRARDLLKGLSDKVMGTF